jgi:hypothetical protein
MIAITRMRMKGKTRCLEGRQRKKWRMAGRRGIKGKIKTKNTRRTLRGETSRNPGKRRNRRPVLTVQGTGVIAAAVAVAIRRKVMVRGVRGSLQSDLDPTIIERLEERRNVDEVFFSLHFLIFTLHSFLLPNSRIAVLDSLLLL